MRSSSTSTIVGWTLSITLYIFLLTLGIYILQTEKIKNIKYTASKKNLLNVTLVERKKQKIVKKKKLKVVKKIKTIDKEKPKEVKKTLRIKKISEKEIKAFDKDLYSYWSINTPEDYKRIKNIWEKLKYSLEKQFLAPILLLSNAEKV
jgi:molybdopterin-guanine dinucleotide biosynthesis protein A